ncbi:hypothetical protein ACVGWK_00565, partial [Enterobacter sichuanensis]
LGWVKLSGGGCGLPALPKKPIPRPVTETRHPAKKYTNSDLDPLDYKKKTSHPTINLNLLCY